MATCHPNRTLAEFHFPADIHGRTFPVHPKDEDKQLQEIDRRISAAVVAGASIVVLPELCVTESLAARLQYWTCRTGGPTSHRSTGRNRPLIGTGTLIRFALRRERLRIPLWALGTGLLVGYVGTAVPLAYSNPAAMQARAEIMKDPAGALLAGPGYGLDDYALGPMLANEILGMAAVAAALMSVFLVVRHTRAEEETGRAELILAGRVGRLAPLTSALVTLLAANAAVFAAAIAGNDLPVADALALAAGAALVGMAFGCLAAVTAQLAEQARTASGMAGGLVGVAFLVRGIGDSQQLGGSALSWFSPIGWAQQTRAFVDLRWWPLLLCAGLATLLTAVAYFLVARRDLGPAWCPPAGDARTAPAFSFDRRVLS